MDATTRPHRKIMVFSAGERRRTLCPGVAIPAPGFPPSDAERQRAPFRQVLHELGWVVGQNLVLEDRWAEGQYDRLPEFAGELVRLPVDVIITAGAVATAAAPQATSAI